MKFFKKYILFFLIPIFFGCANDVANRYYVADRYSPKNPTEVELLWEKPKRDFIVIADFQSRGESPEDVRKKAAEIGADAVIVALLGGYATGDAWVSTNARISSYSRITGTAIKFK